MRVSLPVQPRLKTLSEHATINYIRQHTELAAPQVFASEARNDNDLGFEWMIMQRVPGSKLSDQWRHMSWMKKELLVRKVIEYQVQLFHKRFPRLGNLYLTSRLQALPTKDIPNTTLLGNEHSDGSTQYCLSQTVSIPLFYHNNWKLDVARGPYRHSQDWLAARLQIAVAQVDNAPAWSDDEGQDEYEIEEAVGEKKQLSDNEEKSMETNVEVDSSEDEENDSDESDDESDILETDPHLLVTKTSRYSRIQRMIDLLPKVFPKEEPEEYMLHHGDLHMSNILVDSDHNISGIIDWECVHTVPVWLGCQIPKFLLGEDQRKPPEFRTEFEDDSYERDYWHRVAQYEKLQLRKFFLDEMGRVCPEWIQAHEAGAVKADFDFAIDIVPERGTYDFDLWLKQIKYDRKPLPFRAWMGQA